MPGGARHAPRPRQAAPAGSLDEGRIADVIRPVVAAAGMDLESVRVTAAGRRRLLRGVVDSDRGVSLDDAAAVSRELSAALDTVAVMGDFPYTLEVSSPGQDRPLTKPQHYTRFLGRRARVRLREANEGHKQPAPPSKTVVGELVGASDSDVTIAAGDGILTIPYAQIVRSNLVPGD